VRDRPGEAAAHLGGVRIELARQPPPAGQLAQQLEQPQVGPRARLALVHGRLDDGDGTGAHGVAQHRLELAERRLALRNAAEVVLVEVEQGRCHAP
jgi:hypothetical protein